MIYRITHMHNYYKASKSHPEISMDLNESDYEEFNKFSLSKQLEWLRNHGTVSESMMTADDCSDIDSFETEEISEDLDDMTMQIDTLQKKVKVLETNYKLCEGMLSSEMEKNETVNDLQLKLSNAEDLLARSQTILYSVHQHESELYSDIVKYFEE